MDKMDIVLDLDLYFFNVINQRTQNDLFDFIMPILSDARVWSVLAVIWVLVVFFKQRKSFLKPFFLICLSLSASDLVSYRIIKPWVERPRPCFQVSSTRLLAQGCGSPYGFPSNHASNAMALVIVLYLIYRKFLLMGLLLAFAVGYSRIYLGVHFPLDILAGFGVGCICAMTIVIGYTKLEKNSFLLR